MTKTEAVVTIVVAVFGSGGLWALLTAIITSKLEKRRKEQVNDEDVRAMLRGLGHDRICYLGECYVKRGYITKDEYENLVDYLYRPYKGLGGNGTAEKIILEVNKLPIVRDESMKNSNK